MRVSAGRTCGIVPSIRCGGALRCLAITARRPLTTLAIETSCDDTAVAVLSTPDDGAADPDAPLAVLHHNKRVTADNRAWRGIHPIASLDSHERVLAGLLREAIPSIPTDTRGESKPDFVSVTRGPGMRSSLNVGLNVAKGLSVAWDVPMLGVHHMQAHALTPRLASALASATRTGTIEPAFPFLTLLVSGGHSLLLHSKDLTTHCELAATMDIAIGDYVDKCALDILPEQLLATASSTAYGPLLERFAYPDVSPLAFSTSASSPRARIPPAELYDYHPPGTVHALITTQVSRYGWGLAVPLTGGRGGTKVRSMEFSFAGLGASVRRIAKARLAEGGYDETERRLMAREAMRVAFEHVAGRVVFALDALSVCAEGFGQKPRALVVSGGVASNTFLKALLRSFLDAHRHTDVELIFPPPVLCTDNAAMIGWAGLEMWRAGWSSELSCQSVRPWSLDPSAGDGGILGVGGWTRRDV